MGRALPRFESQVSIFAGRISNRGQKSQRSGACFGYSKGGRRTKDDGLTTNDSTFFGREALRPQDAL